MSRRNMLALPALFVGAIAAVSAFGFDLLKYRPVLNHELAAHMLVADERHAATSDELAKIKYAMAEESYTKWAAIIAEYEAAKKAVPAEFRARLNWLRAHLESLEAHVFGLKTGD